MNKMLTLGVSTAVLLGSTAILAPVALADPGSPGCVTRAEFKKVDIHGADAWTRDHVTRVFGTKGHVTSTGSGGTTVQYHTCAGDWNWSYAEVDFSNHKADFKWIYISTV